MKISFLLTTADAMGGTERAVYLVASLLAKRHEVEVLSVFRTSAEPFFSLDDRVKVRYLVDTTGKSPRPVRPTEQPQSLFDSLAALPSEVVEPTWEAVFNRLSDVELRTALEQSDADVVIATTPPLMALLAEFAPNRMLTVAQEHRVSELRGVTGEPLPKYAPLLDAMVTLTEPTRDWFAECLGDVAPHLAVIGNPMPEGYRPRAGGESRTVLFAGRLVGEKQPDHAILAFAALADRFPDWRLRILGSGPMARPSEQLANDLGIRDQVEFLGSTPDMPEEFAKSSVFLMTSRNEAFGLVLMEALSSGVPVVSYACPNGPAEIVTPGSDGLLVPPQDIEGLTAALAQLMGDAEQRKAFGAAGRENVKRFSGERIAEQWNELLEMLDQERRSGRREERRAERMVALAAVRAAGGPNRLAPGSPTFAYRELDQKTNEVRLEALHGGKLMRAGGQLCRIDDETFPFEAAQDNLDLVVDVANELGIPYVLLRNKLLRHSVAIPAEHRRAFIARVVERYRDRPVYAALLSERNTVHGRSLAGLLLPDELDGLAGLRLFEPVVTTSGSIRLGDVYGCTVSFWEQLKDETTGELREDVDIVGGTVFGPALPKATLESVHEITVGEHSYRSAEAFSWDLLDDIDFPVDAVYTWVDDTDPAWNERRREAMRAAGREVEESAGDDARFRNRDELRYSLRSLDMYAPWIRNIYLLTDDQTPAWLDTDHPRIKVVSHREVLTGRATLPTFNSHAIETGLHRIEGLSEQFLYLNDDVFFGRALQPSAFFTGAGQSLAFPSGTSVPPVPASETDGPFLWAAKNNRELLDREFGRVTGNTYLHTPHALRRSVIAEIEQKFPEEFHRTAEAQFRSNTDIAVPSSLHHSYGLATGRAVVGKIGSGFVNVGLRAQHPKLNTLLTKRGMDVFCLNDYHDGDVSADEQADIMAVFLASYFPTASQFEKDSNRNRRYAHRDAK